MKASEGEPTMKRLITSHRNIATLIVTVCAACLGAGKLSAAPPPVGHGGGPGHGIAHPGFGPGFHGPGPYYRGGYYGHPWIGVGVRVGWGYPYWYGYPY